MSINIDFQNDLSASRHMRISSLCRAFGVYENSSDCHERHIEVLVKEQSIRLRSLQIDPKAWIEISFDSGASNHRRLYGGGRSQSLAKALGLDKNRELNIVDATAGLAADSFVMACLGAKVFMLERSPFLALMIQDALELARSRNNEDKELLIILERMQLFHVDAADWIAGHTQKIDVVYLDPMFPVRKKMAAVKKEMQVLQSLLQQPNQKVEEEEEQLLDVAHQKAVHRIVVKRPAHAPFLANREPGYSIKGKSTRFDIYPKKSILTS